MLSFLKSIFSLNDDDGCKPSKTQSVHTSQYEHAKVSRVLEENKAAVKSIFDKFSDLIIRRKIRSIK